MQTTGGSVSAETIAVVTGAGSGLGRAFSRALAAAGFTVAAIGRHRETLEATLDGLAGAAFVADIGSEVEVDKAFDNIERQWGRIDLLVNNAGILGPNSSVADLSPSQFDETMTTNVRGAFLCARRAMQLMRRQNPPGGRIINNGSIAAHVPRPLSAAYAISKHSITGLTRSIALDGRPYGIACGQIDIGNAASDRLEMVTADALQPDGTRRSEPTFSMDDAARAVVLMATLPLEANVLSMTVTATAMPLVGRG